MSDESLEEFYGGLLGVESPWVVEEIVRDAKVHEVWVHIVFAEG
ncbi:MAG: hypothetical protein WCQ50_16740 [Spirochaetota bacterium]